MTNTSENNFDTTLDDVVVLKPHRQFEVISKSCEKTGTNAASNAMAVNLNFLRVMDKWYPETSEKYDDTHPAIFNKLNMFLDDFEKK